MDSTPRSIDTALLPWLLLADEGAVIVTSNQRAARFLLEQHTAYARSKGLAGWATPRILTWDAWLSSLWQEVTLADAAAPMLLRPEQEHELWRGAVAASGKVSPWNEVALATLAQQAWQLLQQYSDGLPSLNRYSLHREDWQQFQKWAIKFASDCRRNGWLSRSQLSLALEEKLRLKQWRPPAQLIFWGFDTFTPAQERLQNSVASYAQIHGAQPSTQSVEQCNAKTFAFASQEDELRAAASWARRRLASNPQARLAVITTKARDDRGLAYRIFSHELAADAFSFSLGFPLSHFPLVRTALALLRWSWQPLPSQQISSLLLSFSLNDSLDSLLHMGQFDCDLFLQRKTADASLSLDQFTQWLTANLRKTRSKEPGELLRGCQAVLRLRPARDAATADVWADFFRKVLSAFRFPAALASSSADFQTNDRWEQLLLDFAALSFHGARFSADDALTRLQKMADDVVFQPSTPSTSVQILGPLEAAGSLFDGIFFLNCTEDRWPIPIATNPLLPLDLQQALQMPGGERGANVTAAKQMTERLMRSAPEVFFSYHTREMEDEVRPSTVIAAIPRAPAALQQEFCAEQSHPESICECVDDEAPMPWAFSRGHLNVTTLRSQAACPFQAFSNFRLGTCELKSPEDGFDLMQRGNIVHELLHAVWLGKGNLAGMKTSAKLRELVSAGALKSFVDEHAAAAVRAHASSAWEREYLNAERERVSTLLCRWLTEVELKRPPFEVIEGEAKCEIVLENLLELHVRLDRVDRLIPEENSTAQNLGDELVLIDYKTGKVNLTAWMPPRLDEPQLPIYGNFAVASEPVAIAFGQITSGKDMALKGVETRPGILPYTKTTNAPASLSFAEIMAGWRADILHLAREFAGGEARVDPKYGDETCKFCGLQSLCRVAESGVLLRDDGDESAEATGESYD